MLMDDLELAVMDWYDNTYNKKLFLREISHS